MLYILIGAAILIVVLVVIGYWQLVVTEGAYLGRPIVALMYDWFAPRYDKVKEFDPANDALMLAEPVLRYLSETAEDSGREAVAERSRSAVVLDVATGTGRLPEALMLQPAFRGHVVAIDASNKMLDVARQKLTEYGGRIDWLHADAQQLDFADGTFDVVASLEALEFFPSPERAVHEMIRVLKPGGLLMLSNRVGPDAWKFPGRVYPTPVFCQQLEALGLVEIEPNLWLVDYDLITAVKAYTA